MRSGKWTTGPALVIAMTVLGIAAADAAPTVRVPRAAATFALESTAPFGSATTTVANPGDAAGSGRWGQRIKRIAEVAGCALDGAAMARVFVVGVAATGGAMAVAVIGVAALACMG